MIPFDQFARINAVTIAVLIAFVSLTPSPDDLAPANDWSRWVAEWVLGDPMKGDKVSHFLAYAALGCFSGLGWNRPYGRGFIAGAIVFGYSGAMEILQGFVATRTSDPADMMANGLGILLGIAIAFAFSPVVKFLPFFRPEPR